MAVYRIDLGMKKWRRREHLGSYQRAKQNIIMTEICWVG